MAKKQTPSSEVEKWLGHIKAYEREFQKWEDRADKIIRRYKDDQSATARNTTSAKFNILWSNVQTLQAATFAKLPKPDVSRRFRDNDPVGRVASLILERALDYEIQHYRDYRYALKASVLDRFLGGRGTAWVRYEPHFKAMQEQLPVDGLQVTEDVDAPQEELDYECAPIDYVHWRDFGHTLARTWDEVSAVWRKVYMTREALVARFGEDGEEVPLDAVPEEFKQKDKADPPQDIKRGLIYEIWDKETKQAIWLSKSLGKEMDRRDDPLELVEFYPCPKPLFATLSNESLVPVPDFTLYQDQAHELDICADRIDGLVKALQVKGCYDASITALGRLFTEGENTNLIPVKNWAAFAEKQGLKGAIDILDLKPIYEALQGAYMAMEQIKNQIYEITGISDIVRGQSQGPAKTATEQQLKGQFASLRLKSYQEQVAEYAAEAIQIKAQIICNKFSPETILKISAADQLSQQDKQLIPQAMMLLIGPRALPQQMAMLSPMEAENPMRSFRIEIESDSLVYLDDQENKESRLQFLQVQGGFIDGMVKALAGSGPMAPALVSPLMEMWKFSAQAFKVGKGIEGSIDEASEQVKKVLMAAAQQPPPPDPAVIKGQMDLQREQMINQREAQLAPLQMQTEAMKAQSAKTKAEADVIKSTNALAQAQFEAMNPPQTGQVQ